MEQRPDVLKDNSKRKRSYSPSTRVSKRSNVTTETESSTSNVARDVHRLNLLNEDDLNFFNQLFNEVASNEIPTIMDAYIKNNGSRLSIIEDLLSHRKSLCKEYYKEAMAENMHILGDTLQIYSQLISRDPNLPTPRNISRITKLIKLLVTQILEVPWYIEPEDILDIRVNN